MFLTPVFQLRVDLDMLPSLVCNTLVSPHPHSFEPFSGGMYEDVSAVTKARVKLFVLLSCRLHEEGMENESSENSLDDCDQCTT